MTLEQFKQKAASSSTDASLEKIQGGGWSDCHGTLGQLGKACTKDNLKEALRDWYRSGGPDRVPLYM